MYKFTTTFTDYNGNDRTETHLFHLNQAEIAKMEMSVKGGMTAMIQRIIDAQDSPALIKAFEGIVEKAYGIKDLDGRGFMKKPEYFEDFKSTEAYSQLFIKLITDTKFASEFVNGIIPQTPDKTEPTENVVAIN